MDTVVATDVVRLAEGLCQKFEDAMNNCAVIALSEKDEDERSRESKRSFR